MEVMDYLKGTHHRYSVSRGDVFSSKTFSHHYIFSSCKDSGNVLSGSDEAQRFADVWGSDVIAPSIYNPTVNCKWLALRPGHFIPKK